MKQCDCHGCKNTVPYCKCQWGTDSIHNQTAVLCKEHAEELFKNLDGLLKVNKAWLIISNVVADAS